MVKALKFVNGLDPIRLDDRAVAFAERRSHAAKNGHQYRRKAGSRQRVQHSRPLLIQSSWKTHQDNDELGSKVTTRARATFEHFSATGSALGSPTLIPHVVFSDSIFDRRSFAFWLSRTKRFTSRDGAMDDVLEWIIPQYAWSSPSVHHMLIAHSIFHEITTIPGGNHDTISKARAVRHYVEGLHNMRGPQTTLVEILLSSYLAWIVEGLQDRDETAAVHVKGWKSLLQNANEDQYEHHGLMSNSEVDIVTRKIAPMLNRAEGIYMLSMAKMEPLQRTEANYGNYLVTPSTMAIFSTSEEAKREIVRIILRIHEAKVKDDLETVLNEMRIELRRWIRNDLYWNDIDVDPICRGAIVLLFDIATAMLPAKVAVGMSCSENNAVVSGILSRAHHLSISSSGIGWQNRAEALSTLRLVARLCMKMWGDQGYADECYALLRSIET